MISVALLVEIANNCLSGVATESILYPCFVNWGTTGSHLIFTFHLRLVNSFLKVRMETILFPQLYSR